MDREQAEAAIEQVGALLAERYNVVAVDGPLGEAFSVLRASVHGDDQSRATALAKVDALVAERPLYRWQEPVAEALVAVRDAFDAAAPPPVEEPDDVSRLTIAELTARLNERGVAVPDGSKKADLVELLTQRREEQSNDDVLVSE